MTPILSRVSSDFGFGKKTAEAGPGAFSATGGVKYDYNGKTIHTFTSTQDFVATGPSTQVEYFIVAGGGSGGNGQNNNGGQAAGGGGGGVLSGIATVSAGTYTVTIGNGGSAQTSFTQGNPGSPSSVAFPSPLVATGGGGGGQGSPTPGLPGGSGGGGGPISTGTDGINGLGTTGQGYPGGVGGGPVAEAGAGGGGGAGNIGMPYRGPWAGPGQPNPQPSAVGGIGRQAPKTFRDPAHSYGTPGPHPGGFYFAGGGGAGGTAYLTAAGAGGAGGGGAGGPYPRNPTTNGTTNTGGGGGATSAGDTVPVTSGGGGSGIVLLAYPSAPASPSPISATGGDVTATPGNGYKYHTFTTSGPSTFVVSSGVGTAEVLVVAGGGGGSGQHGGGGGGGGVTFHSSYTLTPGTYNIHVGAGGAGGSAGPNGGTPPGAQGSPSFFENLIAIGGGVGASGGGLAQMGYDGGCGGGSGSSRNDYNGGLTRNVGSVPGATYYGNPGFRRSSVGPSGKGGGGGGAGAGGPASTSNSTSHDGGSGQQFPNFTGPLIGVTPLAPLSGYFAGGGGGGAADPPGSPSPGTSGGLGGGGNGGPYGSGPGNSNAQGTAGTTNSGGGGGGGGAFNVRGESGGSGIVVIRYPT